MALTEAQARRALRHADIPWDAKINDPRASSWVVHAHLGILGGLAAAFAVGCSNLRRAEDFFSDLGIGTRRALGLGRGTPCDTTFYRLLVGQSPTGFEETVFQQVKQLIAGRVVKNDHFRMGVMNFDGKGTWSRAGGEEVDGARQSWCDEEGTSLQTVGALRAVLASSSVCPCVSQKIIGSKEGESPAFRELFPKVCHHLGAHFQIVTGDAGLCARENAELVSDHDRFYLYGLKGNQPHLLELAQQHGRYFSRGRKPLARTEERYRANTIVRELYACTVAGDPQVDMKDARQFFYVNQTTYGPDGDPCAVELRYFVTSLPEGMLTRDEELALVRLMWAIENGCNWTMDMVLGEDDSQPCQANKTSIETVSWLRIIGYNALSAWRRLLPAKDRKPASWRRATQTLRDALVVDWFDDVLRQGVT